MGLGYAAGPMVGGAAFVYENEEVNPLGAFELQQRITSAGQTIATKIDNTLNRPLAINLLIKPRQIRPICWVAPVSPRCLSRTWFCRIHQLCAYPGASQVAERGAS